MDQWLLKIYLAVAAFVSVLVLISSGFLFGGKNGSLNFEKKSDLSANQLAVLPIDSPNATASPVAEKPLKMVFLGDAMLDRDVALKIKQRGLAYLFEKIKDSDLLQNKDIISCNLEGALTNGGQHYSPDNGYDFAFSPETVGQLKNYGFNFFNLANNHFADQGQRGINETYLNLDSQGINYSGCPDGQIGDCSYKIIEVKNKKIAFFGFSAVYSKLDLDNLKELIGSLKKETDFVVVNFHWGSEYQHKFSHSQQEYARALIDSGADIIIGHHPHVVQGIEIYQGKPIFYSLGNFIFDQYFSVDTQQGLALDINLNADKAEFFLIPLEIKQGQAGLMGEESKKKFLQKLVDWSEIDFEYKKQIEEGRIILER